MTHCVLSLADLKRNELYPERLCVPREELGLD
jgi:hypothetical protein